MPSEPPSTLHARLEEFIGELVDRRVPREIYAVVGKAYPLLSAMGGVLPGVKLPALNPADLPRSPAELKALFARELRARPPADLARLIETADLTCRAWLYEYAHSIDTSFYTPGEAADGAAPSSDSESSQEIAEHGSSPDDPPTPNA